MSLSRAIRVPNHILVTNDNPTTIALLDNDPGIIYTRHLRGNDPDLIAKGYVNNPRVDRKAKIRSAILSQEDTDYELHISTKDRTHLFNQLDRLDQHWYIKSIDTTYLNDSLFHKTHKEYSDYNTTSRSIEAAINESYQTYSTYTNRTKSLLEVLSDINVNPNRFFPVTFELEVNAHKSNNSANVHIFISQDDKNIEGNEIDLALKKAELGINLGYIGNTIPFCLFNVLIAIFGSDLRFDMVTSNIQKFLDGHIKIQFGYRSEETDLLNSELRRWLTSPTMTIERFIRHCSLYMLPVTA
jgi:hypothetical protein